MFAAPAGTRGVTPNVTYIGTHNWNGGAVTNHTFTDIPLGDARTKYLVFVVSGFSEGSFAGASIRPYLNGVQVPAYLASQPVLWTGPDRGACVEIYGVRSALSVGSVMCPGTLRNISLAVYAINGEPTPLNVAAAAGTTNPIGLDLTVDTKTVVVAGTYGNYASSTAHTWAGVTENYDAIVGTSPSPGGSIVFSHASHVCLTDETPRAITVSRTGYKAAVACAFRVPNWRA